MFQRVRRILARALPEELWLGRKISRELSCGELLLVHQMGKVGSASVLETLQGALEMPVYQTHHLSNEGLKDARRFYHQLDSVVPYNIRFAKALRSQLPRVNRLRVLTLVREPIAREISAVFQLGTRCREISGDPGMDRDLLNRNALAHIHSSVMLLKDPKHYVNLWFDREMRDMFDVDVFAHGFDPQRGYTIIDGGRVDVMVLRLEDLSRVWDVAIREFLGHDVDCPLRRCNVSSEKSEAEAWRYVTENLCLAKQDCVDIYSSRLGEHFYGDIREDLIKKWTGTRKLEE